MARPTIYDSKILTKSLKYLSSCRDTKNDVNLPTVEGLGLSLGVSRSIMYEWKESHDEFSDILEEIMREQGKRLINKGLSGKYNSTIAKLILSKHGYKDQVGLSGEGEGESIKIDADITQTLDKIYGGPGPSGGSSQSS